MKDSLKIQKIEELGKEQLSTLLVKILLLQGFTNIQQLPDCIKGEQKAFLKVSQAIFITFSYKLSGNVDINEITGRIISLRDKYLPNNIYVYSGQNISKGFQKTIATSCGVAITFIDRDEFIQLIDENFSEYWKHDDTTLLEYEKHYLSFLENDSELKRLSLSNDKYQKLSNIFIEPQLIHYYQDKQTNTPISKKYSISDIINHNLPVVIDGYPGSGKSTLLKKIGQLLIENNSSDLCLKNLPIYLSASDLFKAEYNVIDAILGKLPQFSEECIGELAKSYHIHILIDSIDEFEEQIDSILDTLNKLYITYAIKFYIASRNGDSIVQRSNRPISLFNIKRFNITQIKSFITAFFSGDEGKSSSLIEALKDNQMIERLPITPLTLSLISILYEETEFEIPATISDIYDNFNTLIIGKAVVSSKIEFIDISFKERILSKYALHLLQSPNHIPLTKTAFIEFFKQYYEGKSLPIKKGTLEDVLLYLIQNTGILFVREDNSVQFSHDSYMEYYAAVEIFKHQRSLEIELINNFYDVNWQNAAVFYCGMSKDMPEFLFKIKEKISNSQSANHFMTSIWGAGYVLQALYQTDNILRKEVICEVLKLSLKNLELFKLMATDDVPLFKDYKLPIINLINFIYFYEAYNSITLKEPLKLAFEEKLIEFRSSLDKGVGYNLIELAFTLNSKRIGYINALEAIVDESEIIRDPNLNMLALLSLDLMGKDKYKDIKNELKKAQKSLGSVQRKLIEQPINKLRFSAYDTISQQSNVKIFVEGKTDASILEHAFMVLTDGTIPYWTIRQAGHNADAGSADEVAKTLERAYSYWALENDSIIIGIFDHDKAGLSAFNGQLKKDDFQTIESNYIKKHKDGNIYGICIPIPGEMEYYINQRQDFNFFEIEHYFSETVLSKHDMIKQTDLPNIFEIKGDKTKFASLIRKETSPEIFENFLPLFQTIDKISGIQVNYIL